MRSSGIGICNVWIDPGETERERYKGLSLVIVDNDACFLCLAFLMFERVYTFEISSCVKINVRACTLV